MVQYQRMPLVTLGLIVVILIFMLTSIFYKGKHKLIIGLVVGSISIIFLALFGKYMVDIGIIADEKSIGGDSVSFIIFLMIAGLSILNPIILILRQKE